MPATNHSQQRKQAVGSGGNLVITFKLKATNHSQHNKIKVAVGNGGNTISATLHPNPPPGGTLATTKGRLAQVRFLIYHNFQISSVSACLDSCHLPGLKTKNQIKPAETNLLT